MLQASVKWQSRKVVADAEGVWSRHLIASRGDRFRQDVDHLKNFEMER
jgi:hypothetical protein